MHELVDANASATRDIKRSGFFRFAREHVRIDDMFHEGEISALLAISIYYG